MIEEWLKQGILGLVVFSVGGALVYVYREARKAERARTIELANLMKLHATKVAELTKEHAAEIANLMREWRTESAELTKEWRTSSVDLTRDTHTMVDKLSDIAQMFRPKRSATGEPRP